MAEREQHSTWRGLCREALSHFESDVLACCLAPEAEPSLGMIFQGLQPGGAEPYPTIGLIQDLLALDSEATRELYEVLAPMAPLRRNRLIRVESVHPFSALRPAPGGVRLGAGACRQSGQRAV